MTWNEPLALENLFINTLAGSTTIFTFIAIIAISIVCARFRVPDKIFWMILVVFAALFGAYIGGLYLLVIIILGLIIYEAIGSFMR